VICLGCHLPCLYSLHTSLISQYGFAEPTCVTLLVSMLGGGGGDAFWVNVGHTR